MDHVFGIAVQPAPPGLLQGPDSSCVPTWPIDEENFSAAREAVAGWQDVFTRGAGQPGPEESCVVTVIDPRTGAAALIDLSDERFAHLFE